MSKIVQSSEIQATQDPAPIDTPYAGSIKISVVSSLGQIPIENATVICTLRAN